MGLFKISYMLTLLDYLRDTWIEDKPPATVEWEVAGLIPVNRPTLGVLKWPRNEATVFALKMARHSRGFADHVKSWSYL